ncbi:MAG: MFS transporter [Ktedonobacteraceae bacterium]
MGVGWCFLLNALSYLVVLAWLLAGPEASPRLAHSSHEPALKVSNAGWNTVSVRTLLVLVAVVSLLGRSYPTVLPILVSRTWGGGARTFGTLATLPGVGAALAAVFVVWVLGRRERKPPWWLGGTLLGVAFVCLGMASSLVVAGLALLATGWIATGTMTLLNARLQELTSNEGRGRVMSLYTWLAAGMPALGGWLLGTLIGVFPVQVVLVTSGITLVGVTLVVSLRPHTDIGDDLRRQFVPKKAMCHE